MTHVTDERKAQLDAAAEERAACLEEVKHPVAGVHVQSLIDEPESYHAGQLTPAYHVPGNVERNPLFPLTTESIQEAATEGVELVPADPVVIDIPVIPLNDSAKANATSLDSAPDIETKKYSDRTTATGVAPIPDQSPEQQAALDATAAERAATFGLPYNGPQPYHANALTPTHHVPGNVERNPLFPLTTESIQEAATEGVELIPSSPSAADLELGEGTLPEGVESIKPTGVFAEPSAYIPEAPPVDNAHVADGCEQFAEQEQTLGNA